MRVIAVYSIKGGVGKTSTAVNLAHLSARHGARTLLWDLDPQGAATYYFRVEHRIPGKLKKLVRGRRELERYVRGTDYDDLDLLPSDFAYRNLDLMLDATPRPRRRLAKLVRPLARRYDHLYLDCAPSISLVSEGVFRAADAILVPTIPTPLSLRTLQQLRGHLQDQGHDGLRVLPFFCMVDRRKALHRQLQDDTLRDDPGFLRSHVPYASVVEQMGRYRKPLAEFAPASEAARAYASLWREAMERTGSLAGWLSPFSRQRFPF